MLPAKDQKDALKVVEMYADEVAQKWLEFFVLKKKPKTRKITKKDMRTLAVIEAQYVDGHRLRLNFSDGTAQVVDFKPFLLNHPHPQHNKYRKLTNFKRFKIERGNLVWGRDWDLIFPVSQLHQGYVAPAMY